MRFPRLGVDFGTSHTVAVLGWPDGRTTPLLFDGSPLLTSAVLAAPGAQLLTGRDATHAARARPECFEPHPKSRIDDGTVLFGEVEVPVEDLIAAVLRRVADEASRVAGDLAAPTIVTCPAGWGQPRRDTLQSAATTVFGQVTLVTEPVAAASHFVHTAAGQVPVGGCAAVYDLGAGTFDASVVRRVPDGFEVLATTGLDDTGGRDVDSAIVGHLAETYAGRDEETWRRLVSPATADDRRESRLLWDDVRTGKEMLSRVPSTLLHIPLFRDDVPLGREQLDQLARPVLERTVDTMRSTLAAAGVAPGDLAGLFLVGGASRTPLVATMLHQALGIAPTVIDQPELAVADGSIRAGIGLAAAASPATSTGRATPADRDPAGAALPTRAPVPGDPELGGARPDGARPAPATARWRRWVTEHPARSAVVGVAALTTLAVVVGTAVALAVAGDATEGGDPPGLGAGTAAVTAVPGTGTGPPTPSASALPSSVADQCLLGTWELISSYRKWDIGGTEVYMSSTGDSTRYFRPDGSTLLDFGDGYVEQGRWQGRDYRSWMTGTISANYRTSGDMLLWINPQADGLALVSINGEERYRDPLRASTGNNQYTCSEELLQFYTDDASYEWERVSWQWDE